MRKRKNPIIRLMKAKTVSFVTGTDWYEPSIVDLRLYYNLLNRYIFKGALSKPQLEIDRLRGAWGYFSGYNEGKNVLFNRSHIVLTNKYPTKQLFVIALAHEMVHQYQWEIVGPKRIKEGLRLNINHGPSFLEWRNTLNRFGIPLKRAY